MSASFARGHPVRCSCSTSHNHAAQQLVLPQPSHSIPTRVQQHSIACFPPQSQHQHHSIAASTPRCRTRQLSKCQAAARTKAGPIDAEKEAHKIFDEAAITVRSGHGGDGEIVEAGRGKWVSNNKYHAGANQSKKIWLPASLPAEGADGADIVVVCDPSLDSLLHLHKRKEWAGRRGAQGNPAVGSAGPKRLKDKKAATPPLEIPVPPGTVVKRKGGQVLGEVIQPGDRLVVAAGGKGGRGVVAPSRIQKQAELKKEYQRAQKAGAEVVAVEDPNWRDDAKGHPGQQLGLTLMLRVVADVGLVGFPNAGKSSLLAALTRASPEVAPYPFTTLMPNLGVLAAGGSGPVLADLPGLIEGAHLGKGLGRMFLRHLRRTRLLLQVVDASAADPGTDYLAVREELRMYNPEYVTRPHVVALNKVDLEDAGGLRQEISDEVMAAARQLQEQHADDVSGLTAPAAVVPCSAITGEGLQELAAALQSVLQQLSAPGSEGSAIAQLVGQELQQQDQQRRRQQQQQQPQQPAKPDKQQQQHADAAAAAGVAAAVSAALAGAGAGSSGDSTAATAAAVAAADATTEAVSAEDQEEGEDWEEGEWEEEEGGEEGEWEALDPSILAALAGGSSDGSSSGSDGWGDDDEEEEEEEGPPPSLPPSDPDAYLLKLSDDELLKLADQAE